MQRQTVKSTNLHSVGHEPGAGMEIQFHAKGCKGLPCSCSGGDVWHYPDATAADHTALTTSKSPGSFFSVNIRGKMKAVKR